MPTARRRFLAGLASLPLAARPRAARAAAILRVGYQAYGTLVLLKASGRLEIALGAHDVGVEWRRFPAGPQMLEALNVGSIDFASTGEVPPVFAQAAGAGIVYVGAEPPAPEAEAIVVPRGSPLFAVGELRRKRIALNKGSNVHWLLIRALQDARLNYHRIDAVFMAPGDARAAFQAGQLDAWAIWDPYFATAEADLGARVLRDGTGLVANREVYLATRRLAGEQPAMIKTVLEAIHGLDTWLGDKPGEGVPLLVAETGLDQTIAGQVIARRHFGVTPITPAILADQQAIADAFNYLGLLAAPVKVADAVWTPPS